jgi:hypothetical protein
MYEVRVDSSDTRFVLNVKIDQLVQRFKRWDTHRQHGDLIGLISLFFKKIKQAKNSVTPEDGHLWLKHVVWICTLSYIDVKINFWKLLSLKYKFWWITGNMKYSFQHRIWVHLWAVLPHFFSAAVVWLRSAGSLHFRQCLKYHKELWEPASDSSTPTRRGECSVSFCLTIQHLGPFSLTWNIKACISRQNS